MNRSLFLTPPFLPIECRFTFTLSFPNCRPCSAQGCGIWACFVFITCAHYYLLFLVIHANIQPIKSFCLFLEYSDCVCLSDNHGSIFETLILKKFIYLMLKYVCQFVEVCMYIRAHTHMHTSVHVTYLHKFHFGVVCYYDTKYVARVEILLSRFCFIYLF